MYIYTYVPVRDIKLSSYAKKSEVNNGDVLFFETNLIGSLHM